MQIGVYLVPFRRLVRVRLLVERHKVYQPHQAPDPLLIEHVILSSQVPYHLLPGRRLLSNREGTHTIERNRAIVTAAYAA